MSERLWINPKKVDWSRIYTDKTFILVVGYKASFFGKKKVGVACGQVVRLRKDRIVLKSLQGRITFYLNDIFRFSFIE